MSKNIQNERWSTNPAFAEETSMRNSGHDIPVITDDNLFLCGCEGTLILDHVQEMSQAIVEDIKANQMNQLTMFELGSGGLLGAHLILNTVLNECDLQYLHLVVSDVAYPETMWGTYSLLPFTPESNSDEAPRLFREELPPELDVMVLYLQDVCSKLYTTNLSSRLDPENRFAVTDEKRQFVDYKRVIPFHFFPTHVVPLIHWQELMWNWNHMQLHALIRRLNNRFIQGHFPQTWVDITCIGDAKRLKSHEEFDLLFGEDCNLLMYDVHMDFDKSQRMEKTLKKLYPDTNIYHAYDMQAKALEKVHKRVSHWAKSGMKRLFLKS